MRLQVLFFVFCVCLVTARSLLPTKAARAGSVKIHGRGKALFGKSKSNDGTPMTLLETAAATGRFGPAALDVTSWKFFALAFAWTASCLAFFNFMQQAIISGSAVSSGGLDLTIFDLRFGYTPDAVAEVRLPIMPVCPTTSQPTTLLYCVLHIMMPHLSTRSCGSGGPGGGFNTSPLRPSTWWRTTPVTAPRGLSC